METRLSRICDRLIEAGWLLAIVLIPVFFNVRTARVFEPDKGMLLRSLALVMAAAWLIKVVEHAVYRLGDRIERGSFDRPRRPRIFYVLLLLSVLFAAVYLGSTLASVHPRISLMGSYQRGQGAYLTFCLIAIGLLVATHLRTRDQVGRLLAAVALGSLPVTIYAVIQSVGVDPLPWGASGPIVASTLGNVDFLAAYLAMAIPLTLIGLVSLVFVIRGAQDRGKVFVRGLCLTCGLIILGLQIYALALTDTRIAPLALLSAAVPFALLLVAALLPNPRRRRMPLGLAGILILGILLALTVFSFTDISLAESPIVQFAGTNQSPQMIVRQLIWQGARELLYTRPAVGAQPDRLAPLRPLLGYGPETMYLTYNSVYQPALGHYEARTASPDRAFNQLLDVGVNLGWVGVVVFLLLLAAFFGAAVAKVWMAEEVIGGVIASGVLWAGLTHFVEAQFSIPIIPTRLLFWVGLGIVAALVAHREEEGIEEHRAADDSPQPVSSGVALLLLPTIALVVVATAGFLRVPQDSIWSGIVMLSGLALAAATAIVNALAGRREPEEESGRCQQARPLANGLLIVLALFLFAGAGLVVNGLLSTMMEPLSGLDLHTMDSVLQFARQTGTRFPLLAWSIVFIGLLSVALALPRSRVPLATRNRRSLVAFPFYILVAAGAIALILSTCVRPMQADAIFKAANPYDWNKQWPLAVKLYERAVELAPQEDFYYLHLGRAQLEQSSEGETTQLKRALETLGRAQALNPLNPDHAANLSRFHRQAAALETDATAQKTHLQTADNYYAEATTLAPKNVVLLNEWALLQWYLHGETQACLLMDRSLELDPEFEQTRQQYTDVCSQAIPDRPQNLDFED